LSDAGMKLYFAPGTSTKYAFVFDELHNFYVQQMVSSKTHSYLIRYITLSYVIDDFSFDQITVKALKFYYGLMSLGDYQFYKLFFDN